MWWWVHDCRAWCSGVEDVVGMFVNTLVLRTSVDARVGFAELVGSVRDVDVEAFAHAHLPFEYLVTELAPVRSEAFALLAQVLLTVDGVGLGANRGTGAENGVTEVGGITLSALEVGDVPANYDLTFAITTGAAGDPGSAALCMRRICSPGRASRCWRSGSCVLSELVADPEVPVGSVELLMGLSGRSWCRWCRGRVWEPVSPGGSVYVGGGGGAGDVGGG